ncbi:MAG: PepSY domain-containing protein [Atopobiaceae bacterium]|nr:PepSY domain-containing protein [Atopobiaceae bacterium]
MTKSNNQAKHMKQNARKSNKGRIVAIALAGVLAIGGAGAVCVAGLGKMPNQAPAAAQMAAPASAATKAATVKKAEPKKTEAPKVQAPAPTSSNSGLEAKVSREQCIKTALAHVGAGGQAKGEAMNVMAKQVIGGGTVYYVVELDLGDVHYTVNVDAIDGNVIGADSTHAGKRVLLDKEGNPVAGTETEVDA